MFVVERFQMCTLVSLTHSLFLSLSLFPRGQSLRYFVNVMDLLVRLALSPGPLSELKFNAVSYINKLSSVKQFQSFLPPSDKSFAGLKSLRQCFPC